MKVFLAEVGRDSKAFLVSCRATKRLVALMVRAVGEGVGGDGQGVVFGVERHCGGRWKSTCVSLVS